MTHVLRRSTRLSVGSLREEWIAALSAPRLIAWTFSPGAGSCLPNTSHGDRRFLQDGKLGAFPRVYGVPPRYFSAGLASISATDGLHNRKWSYDPFKSRWRNFMSLDYNLNVLKDDVKIGSETFLENSKAMEKLLLDLQQKVEKVRLGGGPKAVERHKKRNKFLPRERIDHLLDPGSPFLELSQVACGA